MNIGNTQLMAMISFFMFVCMANCDAMRNSSRITYGNNGYDTTNRRGNTSLHSDKKSEKKNQYENYPFLRSSTKIDSTRVAGIRIKDQEIIYLSYDKTFYKEQLRQNEKFSDITFFQKFSHLMSVEFNNIILDEETLNNLQKFIPHNIKNLVFDGCQIEKGSEWRIAEIYKKMTQLTSLNIKQIKMDVQYVSAITESISALSELNSMVMAFGEMHSDSFNHLASVVGRSGNLKTLSLTFDKIVGDEQSGYKKLLEVLSKAPQVTTLELSIIHIPEVYVQPLINKIRQLKSLKNLRLFFGNMSKYEDVRRFESGRLLATSLKELNSLVNLNISSMQLPGDVMQVIVQSIADLKNLEYLNISDNTINKECGKDLSKSLKHLEHLKTFIARGCSIDSNTFSDLSRAISALPIAILSVGNNQIQEGIKNIPIKSMEELKFIDLANNGIQFNSLMSFLNMIIDHPKLMIIDVNNNNSEEKNITEERDAIEKFKMDNGIKTGIFGW